MNIRQKKKQYKKRYGHNPPRGADGRYLFRAAGGQDAAAGARHTGLYKPEQIEALEDIEWIADSLRDAFSMATQVMADFARTLSETFSKAAKQYGRSVTEKEDPPAVVARHLAERRKKCRRKEWKVSKR